MALTVSNIITSRVRIVLRDIDEGGVQWKDNELIDWFNEACGEIARIRPEASSGTIDTDLVPGCKQSIPVGHSRLLEGICNVVGNEEGRIIRRAERATLDNEDPSWMAGTKAATVLRYVPSETDPRTFYVYPPSLGAGEKLRVVTSAPPAVVSALEDTCPLPDMYAAPIANYILYRAFGKLSESSGFMDRSAGYFNIFSKQMGEINQSMETNNANVRDSNNLVA